MALTNNVEVLLAAGKLHVSALSRSSGCSMDIEIWAICCATLSSLGEKRNFMLELIGGISGFCLEPRELLCSFHS